VTDSLHATANCSKDTECWVLNVVLAAFHAVSGTVTDALTEVIVLSGGAVRDIACLCAFARERDQGAVLSGSVV